MVTSACILLALSQLGSQETIAQELQFNRDIRPILSDRCFLCHGPDQTGPQAKETQLRLDQRESAVANGIFDFENVLDSEILARVTSTDDDRMPPLHSHKKSLSEEEVKRLAAWIEQGAKYENHWAYTPPTKPEVPRNAGDNRPATNEIDAFVFEKLVQVELKPSPPASRETLIRRATLDLTGLPPTRQEVLEFVGDDRSDIEAYEAMLDRLLDSPRYGEHQARFWLDAARYADTSGYQYDFERTQWVWRDWVIAAFNDNKPFDEFTVEQIAGDLIPNANPQTRLATGFNRNHPITIEGGVVDEEYRTEYVIDRVVTTSTVFLGQTYLCARCHDHKFDPISQKNFYEFYAFFNNVPERGLNGFDPQEVIPSPLAKSKIEIARSSLESIQKELLSVDRPFEDWAKEQLKEKAEWITQAPSDVQSVGGADHEILDDGSILFSGKNSGNEIYVFTVGAETDVRSIRIEAIADKSFGGHTGRAANGNFVLTEFQVEADIVGGQKASTPDFQRIGIESASADYEQKGYPISAAIDGKIDRAGWAVDGNSKLENRSATFTLEKSIPAGSQVKVTLHHRFGTSHQIGRVRLSFSSSSAASKSNEAFVEIEKIAPRDRTETQQVAWRSHLLAKYGNEKERSILVRLDVAKKRLESATSFPKTMIMSERGQPRTAYVLARGEYDKPQTETPLTAGIPEELGSMEDFPRNRYGLAQWLVSDKQPLTARVTVNRFWQQLFGTGIVKTSEDFGSQGEFPTHPELLDWLAVDFVDSGWDVKAFFKKVMMSATYRQSSIVLTEALEKDPENRFLSRGPRVRLDGETIRDSALMIAGLLDETLGGPSVYPYHPEGLWLEINNRPNFSKTYPHSTSPKELYRRSMYTFWKRSVPPPSMATFDAPSREYCLVRRSTTNTPLQAFVLLHDPQFIEAAKQLAQSTILRVTESDGADLQAQRLNSIFETCLSRKPNNEETALLISELERQTLFFQEHPSAAEQLLSVGVSKVPDSENKSELAAWTQIVRTILNLSEFVTKE